MDDVIALLSELIQLTITVVHVYDLSWDHIIDESANDNILAFRDDHILHINEIEVIIKRKGKILLEKYKSIKDLTSERMALANKLLDTAQALQLILDHEKKLFEQYKIIMYEKLSLPLDVFEFLQKKFKCQKNYLRHIQCKLLKVQKYELRSENGIRC